MDNVVPLPLPKKDPRKINKKIIDDGINLKLIPIIAPNIKHTIIPKATLSVEFITWINGKATNASSDPIEISTSPAINKTAKPIDAINIIESCPETFIIFLNVKKYSEANEKNTKTITKIIPRATSPLLRYFWI